MAVKRGFLLSDDQLAWSLQRRLCSSHCGRLPATFLVA
jgi:hypothetical protein